jgi:hypothetical protein
MKRLHLIHNWMIRNITYHCAVSKIFSISYNYFCLSYFLQYMKNIIPETRCGHYITHLRLHCTVFTPIAQWSYAITKMDVIRLLYSKYCAFMDWYYLSIRVWTSILFHHIYVYKYWTRVVLDYGWRFPRYIHEPSGALFIFIRLSPGYVTSKL